MNTRRIRILCLLSAIGAPGLLRAQVVLDGTLGPSGPLSGPTVLVPASSGQTVGTNLFHSFSQLDIPTGQTVTFQGPGSIQNVLARVTGGAPSTINGTLRCDIPGADFYLINPAGLVFGPAATVDVGASFAVTSADFIRLGTDGRFDARVPSQSVLTTSAPAAFGFAGSPAAGKLTVRGTLRVDIDLSLTLAGGDVSIIDGNLFAGVGAVNIAATSGASEVVLTTTPAGLIAIDVQGGGPGGAVEIIDNAVVDLGGAGEPGRLTVRAGSLKIRDALVRSETSNVSPQGDAPLAVDLEVTGSLEIGPGGVLATNTIGAGPAGDFRLVADSIVIDGGGDSQTGVNTGSESTGVGGAIDVQARVLRVVNGARLQSLTDVGAGRDIVVRADSVELSNAGQIVTQVRGTQPGGNLTLDVAGPVTLDGAQSGIASSTLGAGDAGDVNLTAQSLRVNDTAFVSAVTNGAGAGGDINISVTNSIELDGANKPDFTGIGSNTQSNDQNGRGGSVNMTAGSMRILDGAGVAAKTFGGPEGGSINMTIAGELFIRGQSAANLTGLNAQALNAGSGGNLTVDAGQIIVNLGQVVANAEQGAGGNISLSGDPVILSADSVINASSQFGVDGSVLIEGQENDFTTGLVKLPDALTDPNAVLQRQCAAVLPTGNVSSFVATGRGGAPPAPTGWSAAFTPVAPASIRPR